MAHDGADEQALMVTLLLKKVVNWWGGAGEAVTEESSRELLPKPLAQWTVTGSQRGI